MKTRSTRTSLRHKKVANTPKRKPCLECGSYLIPCLCVLQNRKKRQGLKKKKEKSARKSALKQSSICNGRTKKCLCKRGPCDKCGASCHRCGCNCDGDEPSDALKRKPGVKKKRKEQTLIISPRRSPRKRNETTVNNDEPEPKKNTNSTSHDTSNYTDLQRKENIKKPTRMKPKLAIKER